MESEYRFTQLEWSKLRYNVKDKSYGYTNDDGLLDRFPDLKREVPALTGALAKLDRDKIAKYIVINYSPTSPLMRVSNLIERKKVAAIETGFPMLNDDRLEPAYEEVLYCKNKEVNVMIISYLRHFRSTKFALICAGTEALYNKLAMIFDALSDKPEDDEKAAKAEKLRGDLYVQASQMEDQLNDLITSFLTDESPYLKDDLFCFIDKEGQKLMLSPELRHAARQAAV